MSEIEIEPKAEFIRKPNLTEPNAECSEGKKLRTTHVRDRNLTEGRIYPKAEFDRTECRMFRSSEVWIEHTT